MDTNKLRAWWFHRQGLDGRLKGVAPAKALAETGWARSVGGVSPYFTLRARAGTSREAADAAVAGLDIHELPSARGCTYVVPREDFALALAASACSGDGDMKVAYKLGVTDKEIAKLSEAILKALEQGPMDPEEIRQATGKASRSLGEEGKKKGVTTTLPLALARLQNSGDIRRVPVNGRLDQQRYRYCLWKPNPLLNFEMDAAAVATELARRYFEWTGPATVAEFQWFSALGAKAAKAALEPLNLEPLEKESALMLLPAHRERFESFKTSKDPQYALVGSIDGITLLKRNTRDLMDEADSKHPLFAAKAYAGSGLTDLPSHAIIDRGRVIGLWEYDPEAGSIVWVSFIGKNKALMKVVEETEEFVKNDLGDARSFSLDSPKSRAPRVEALRSAK